MVCIVPNNIIVHDMSDGEREREREREREKQTIIRMFTSSL